MVTAKCENCGKDFEIKRGSSKNRKYCSRDCYYKSQITAISKVCPICGNTFTCRKNRPQINCSNECFLKSKRIERVCPQCGKIFLCGKKERKKYCSKECRVLAGGDFAGLNHNRAFQEARANAFKDPEYKERQRNMIKSRWLDPEYRAMEEKRQSKKKLSRMYDPLNMPIPKPKFGSEEHRNQKRDTALVVLKDPIVIKKISEGVRKKYADPVWAAEQRERQLQLVKTPEWRRKNSEGQKKSPKTKKHLEVMTSLSIKKRESLTEYERIENSRLRSERNKQMWQDPEYVKKFKETRTGQTRNGESRSRMQEAQIGGYWYGNVRYPEGKIYCEKWCSDLWKRIDAAQDNKSILSGKTKEDNGGRALSRHHVYWQEKACCIWDEDAQGYYAMINVGSEMRPEMYKHYINGDPNKFVLLTRKEHGMIKGNKKEGTTKLTWIKILEELIETKLNGKCYLTKEEYAIYLSNSV
jgi:hypothetical protein